MRLIGSRRPYGWWFHARVVKGGYICFDEYYDFLIDSRFENGFCIYPWHSPYRLPTSSRRTSVKIFDCSVYGAELFETYVSVLEDYGDAEYIEDEDGNQVGAIIRHGQKRVIINLTNIRYPEMTYYLAMKAGLNVLPAEKLFYKNAQIAFKEYLSYRLSRERQDLLAEYQRLLEDLDRVKRQLAAFERVKVEPPPRIEEQIKQIEELPYVTRIKILPTVLIVEVEPPPIKTAAGEWRNRYQIHYGIETRLWSEDWRYEKVMAYKIIGEKRIEGYSHPHISARGILCAGDLTEDIAEAIGKGELATATALIIQALQTYNPESAYVPAERLIELEKLAEGEEEDEEDA